MSRMSELHDDLGTIHKILLGQRKVAQEERNRVYAKMQTTRTTMDLDIRVDTINDLLLEFEAAGIKWPDNVVELNTVTVPTLVKCNECEGRGNLRFIKGDCMHCGGSGKVQHD